MSSPDTSARPSAAPAPPPTTDPPPTPGRPSDTQLLAAKLVPLRRSGQWVSALVLLVLFAMLVHTVLTNSRFQWGTVGDYFLNGSILHGLELTLWLTAAVMATGYLLGIGVAAMRLSRNPVLSSLSFGFVWLLRSVPPLVQLLFWYELASLYPQLSFGIPFGSEFVTVRTAHLLSGVIAAYVGLSLDVAAFASEIVRGGILSVDHGQTEAAQALGVGNARIFRRIVLPQAMPAIVPASGNLLIGTLKATSIVSVIAVQDLLYSSQLIYNQNYLIIPLLLVATLWYIILTTLLSIGQFFVERYYSRGSNRSPRKGFWALLRGNVPLLGRAGDQLAGLS
jgi:polar amino acid transport system permease protein